MTPVEIDSLKETIQKFFDNDITNKNKYAYFLDVFKIFCGRWDAYMDDNFYNLLFENDETFENFFKSSMIIIFTLIYIVIQEHSDIHCSNFHCEMNTVITEFIKLKQLFDDNWGYFTLLNLTFFNEVRKQKLDMIREIKIHMYEVYDFVKLRMSTCKDKPQCNTTNPENKDCVAENTRRYFDELLNYIPEKGFNPFTYPQGNMNKLSNTNFRFLTPKHKCQK